MAKLRHIALTTSNPSEVAEFYKKAFDMQEVGSSLRGEVSLTDGYLHMTILPHKTEEDLDVGPNGPGYSGIHHIGFVVDDMEDTSKKLAQAKAAPLVQKSDLSPIGGRNDFERKWAGPDGVGIDLSQTGWRGNG